tara:strand:- start:14388 stop:14774 length:387 start_codon:yes stop_codon:yes gene_type:complete
MMIEVWLGLALIFSIILNIFLIWFSRKHSAKLFYISQNLSDLQQILSAYTKHLKQIYSMETFYGDENLQFLINHTRSLSDLLEQEYGDITYLSDPMEIEEQYDEEEQEDNEEQTEKDVFYGGARTSNT